MTKKVKVFILLGQSKIVGMGNIAARVALRGAGRTFDHADLEAH